MWIWVGGVNLGEFGEGIIISMSIKNVLSIEKIIKHFKSFEKSQLS